MTWAPIPLTGHPSLDLVIWVLIGFLLGGGLAMPRRGR